MKKVFIAFALCSICLASYSQDSTRNKAEKVKKKVATTAKKVTKDIDNKADSIVKKIFPAAHKVPQ